MFYFKLGMRNIIKNHRRTILTMLTIIIGMVSVIIARGFVDYSMWGLKESTIRSGLGHFQIYKEGFNEHGEEEPYKYLIDDYKSVIREISRIGGIKYFAPRIQFQGIISNDDKSTVVMGFAGWEDSEKRLHEMTDIGDEFLDSSDSSGVVIGSGVAKNLDVEIGEYLTLMSTMKGGGINAIDVKVQGIINHPIKEMDSRFILGQLDGIQPLLYVENSIDRIVLMLEETEMTKKMEKKIAEICKKEGLEYKTWEDLATYYFQVRGMYETFVNVIMIVIISIVIFAIANTMSMNLFERIREIGTMRALGTNRLKIIKIFLAESFLIGILGVLIGSLLGYSLAFLINNLGGISVPPPPGNKSGYQAMIKPDNIKILYYSLIFVGISVVAALYSAIKAAKLSIADALRWI
ncbi:MAG: ABC transporter permease [Fusobacteriota bacterium]